MKKANILIIVTDYGSFNNFLSELSIHLSASFCVHVACSKSRIIKTEDKFIYKNYDVTFHYFDFPRNLSIFRLIKSSIAIRSLIKRISPILVHAHFTTGILPTILFRIKRIEYIGTFHGLGINSTHGLKSWFFYLVESFCFHRLDKIILLNNKDYKLLKEVKGNNAYLLSKYGVGCDLNRFDLNKISGDELRNIRMNFNLDGKFVITFVGRFVEFKGFDIVLKVFNNLYSNFPGKINLLLIGGLDPIHKTGLGDNISLENEAGVINVGFTSSIEKYLAVSDLFFFPSRKEGLPVCLMESLSMGVPVLSYSERGIVELVESGINGVLIQPSTKEKDIQSFIEIIDLFINDRGQLKKLSVNALNLRHYYSRSSYVQTQIEFYLKIINQL